MPLFRRETFAFFYGTAVPEEGAELRMATFAKNSGEKTQRMVYDAEFPNNVVTATRRRSKLRTSALEATAPSSILVGMQPQFSTLRPYAHLRRGQPACRLGPAVALPWLRLSSADDNSAKCLHVSSA